MWNRKAQSNKLKHHSIKTSVAGINPSRTAYSLEIQFSTVSRMVEQGLFSSRIACSAVRAWKLTLLYCKSKSHTNPAFNCRTEWNFFIMIITVGSYNALSQMSPWRVHFIFKLKTTDTKTHYTNINKFVIKRCPPLPIHTHTCAYKRVSHICTETLTDEVLVFPQRQFFF